MLTFMKRVIFFVLLLTIAIYSNSQNLVVNPGFENWSKIDKPSGWSHAENCLKDSTTVLSGNYSVMHSGGISSAKDLGQTIAVTPGNEYQLSLNYKTIITSTGNGARIWCYWKDEAGNSIYDSETDAILRPSKYMKSDTWEQFSINVTAPPEARSFYFEVRTYPNSVAYWDDLVFEENITTYNSGKEWTGLRIYPNPACNYLIISNIYNLQHIDIQSLTGSVIWSGNFPGEKMVTIPVSHLQNGIYLLKITSSSECIIRKFIKTSD